MRAEAMPVSHVAVWVLPCSFTEQICRADPWSLALQLAHGPMAPWQPGTKKSALCLPATRRSFGTSSTVTTCWRLRCCTAQLGRDRMAHGSCRGGPSAQYRT